MPKIRLPAVAGLFYPEHPETLREQIQTMLGRCDARTRAPKALIVPHAGYPYSGDTAARAYSCIRSARHRIRRVVILGPAHRVPLYGLALPAEELFRTPLGDVPIDRDAIAQLADLKTVRPFAEAHQLEHSIEVQLPFLQVILEAFQIVPLVVGDCAPQEVGLVLERLWGGEETLIVISSDLSHYLDYTSAQIRDRATTNAIEQLAFEEIGTDDACGRHPIRGLLHLARERSMEVQTLELCNSGDTAGDRARVVGYGAYAFF